MAILAALTLSAAAPVPLLTEKCSVCHSASLVAPMCGLPVDSRETLLKGGGSGPAIVVGKPAASLFIKAPVSTSPKLPLAMRGKRLIS